MAQRIEGAGLDQRLHGAFVEHGLGHAFDELVERVGRWTQVQRKLARCSAQGQHQIARDSGHNIQLTEPHLIVEAVRRVAEQAAQRR